MARKPLGKSNPVNDVEAKLNADFNQLIKKIHKQLSTKKRSPVYTGFFASSWKVQTMGVKAVDKVEDFQPWASIKKAKKDSWNKDSVKSKNTTYKIQPRFPVDKTFNFKRPVFIGNRAKYAAYALEGGKVQFFVQGELGRLIQETMKDKKGKLFVASRKMQDFGSSKGGVGYTEF
tara:strand:+ start:123 stop:647 length:525 start_codon:yes stop_codon:yes gene_type:complete